VKAVRSRGGLLERDGDVAAIEATLERATRGSGSLLLVEGEAGIGKTKLIAAAREAAIARGMVVLSARGGELEQTVAFGVARQLFEARLAGAPEAERRALLAGAAALAGPAIGMPQPDEAPRAPGLPLGDPAAASQHGLHWLTANLAERRSLLLAIDDLHWSDAASARWLLYLTRRIGDLAVVAIAAVRSGEPGLPAGLLASLEAEPSSIVLEPEPLSEPGAAQLVRRRLGPHADAAFCAACHRVTRGNPFLMSELIEAAHQDGIVPTAESIPRIDELDPQAISRSVLLRLSRLPDGAEPLTRAIAVLGAEAQPRHAMALAELEEEAAAIAADALSAAAILARGRPWRFEHPLIRAAVYRQIPDAGRALAHARAARIVSADGVPPEAVAAHLLRCEPTGDDWSVEILRDAARAARVREAPDAAIAYLRRAFMEPPPRDARKAMLVELLSAGVATGDTGIFDGVADDWVAEFTADTTLLTSSAQLIAIGLIGSGRYEEALEVLTRAAEIASAASDDELAARIDVQRMSIQFDIDAPRALARLKPYENRLAPGSPAESLWLAERAMFGAFGDTPREQCVAFALRALENGHLIGDDSSLVQAFRAILTLLYAGELELADHWIAQLSDAARQRASALAIAIGTAFRSQLAYRRGDVLTAQAEIVNAVDIGTEHGFLLTAGALWIDWRIEIFIVRGELEIADRWLEQLGLAGPLPLNWWASPIVYARCRLRRAQGRLREALDDAFSLDAALAYRTFPGAFSWASTRALILNSLAEQPERVRALTAEELREARRWGTPDGIGIALRTLGLVEGGERGIELLREAVEVLAGSPARVEQSRALTDLGAALRRGNRRAEARDVLRQALDMAHRSGASSIEDLARQELAATGAKPRRAQLSGLESLTPSELRIARMAADGLENKAIAQELFVTVKTVETHLGHIYRKLDVSSRKKLPEALLADEAAERVLARGR
jgi:DNA-binding CsgD family transcriptional regulator